MGKTQKKTTIQSLKGNFRGMTLSRSDTGALTVDVSSLDGVDVTVITAGNARVMKLCPVEEQTNAPGVIKASADKRAYNIGDVLPDGWVVGAVSPTTGLHMEYEPVSEALEDYRTWHEGEKHAQELRAKGHANARQPDEDELNSIYNDVVEAGHNQNAQFNTSDSSPYGRNWASTIFQLSPDNARVQYFDGGLRYWYPKASALAHVRCVRDGPRPSLA